MEGTNTILTRIVYGHVASAMGTATNAVTHLATAITTADRCSVGITAYKLWCPTARQLGHATTTWTATGAILMQT